MVRSLVIVVALCGGCVENNIVDAGPPVLQFLSQLSSVDDLDEVRGAGGDTKFLAQVDGVPVKAPILEPCEFQNTSLYSFHVPFLNAQPGGEDITFDQYVDLVIRRAHRVWWGGDVAFLSTTPHPITGEPGVLIWHAYTEDTAGNQLTLDDVRAVDARLRGCTPGFAGKLAFQPVEQEQTTTVRNGQGELANDGIAVLFP